MKKHHKVTIFSALRNPGTYYFGQESWDWTAPQNAALWRDDAKTLFDPCPAGWRIPQDYEDERSPWAAFTMGNGPESGDLATRGRLFGTVVRGGATAWYPYSGRRATTSGFLGIAAAYSQVWSCTATGTFATSTSFYSTGVLPAYTDHTRGYGFPVRCLRE